MNIKQYYNSPQYLREHKKYLTPAQTRLEVAFLIKTLKLTKSDHILDLACGDGRHSIALARRGFNVLGVDSSRYLIKKAEQAAAKAGLNNSRIDFKRQDIEQLRLTQKFNKAFLLFADLGVLNVPRVLSGVRKVLKSGGLFILDTDTIFRLAEHLRSHPRAPFVFDTERLELKTRGSNEKVRYYMPAELSALLKSNGLQPQQAFGNYKADPFSIQSDRQIYLARLR